MSGMKFLAAGLAVAIGLGAGALVLPGPTLSVLSAVTNPVITMDDDQAAEIVMQLMQASGDGSAGSHSSESTESKPNESNKVASAIAVFFGVSLSEVAAMHTDGLGYGEIVRAFALAKTTGKTVDEILTMKKAGEGWGVIQKSLDVTMGKLETTLGDIMREKASKASKGAKSNLPSPAQGKSKNK